MDDIMNQLNQLLKQIGTRNLIIATIVVVVIVVDIARRTNARSNEMKPICLCPLPVSAPPG